MLLDWGVSIRRACRVLPFDTPSYHYQFRRTDPAYPKKNASRRSARHTSATAIVVPITSCAGEGWVVNAKKVYRLYRELGLQLRNKTPKRLVNPPRPSHESGPC